MRDPPPPPPYPYFGPRPNMLQPTGTLGRKAGAQHPPSLGFKVKLRSRRSCAPTPPKRHPAAHGLSHDSTPPSLPPRPPTAPSSAAAHSKPFRPTFRSREGHGEAQVVDPLRERRTRSQSNHQLGTDSSHAAGLHYPESATAPGPRPQAARRGRLRGSTSA